MKHIHAKIIRQYIDDVMETERPWERWEFKGGDCAAWLSCPHHPEFNEETNYRSKSKTIEKDEQHETQTR